MFEVLEYIDEYGQSPFANWFNGLNVQAPAKVSIALIRMENENLSNTKGVKGGVFEYRMEFGPGYRIYFGNDGGKIIILLGGGTKKGQDKDIKIVKEHWQNYKQRKKVK